MKMPSDWNNAGKVTATTKDKLAKPVEATTKTKAGVVDMSEEVAGQGLCPVCKDKMEHAIADGNYVRVCMAHRVALPLSDKEIEELEAEKAKPINRLAFTLSN